MWMKGGTSELVQVSQYICRIVVTERRERDATDQLLKSEWLQYLIQICEPYIRALPPRGQTRTPLSVVLVNAHVLAEIVVAAECLIATRECARERFFVGMDATDVPLQVFTPGETFPAIGYDADEGPLSFVSAIWNDLAWDSGDTPSTALLGQVGNRNWTGLPATTFRPGRNRDGQSPLFVGGFRRDGRWPQSRH